MPWASYTVSYSCTITETSRCQLMVKSLLILATEILNRKWRDIIGPAYNACFALGYTVLSAMALYWSYWRHLQLAITLCSAPCLLMFFVLPESPRWYQWHCTIYLWRPIQGWSSFRWLFAKSRNVEAKKISHVIAKRNGSPLPHDVWINSLRKAWQYSHHF